MPESEKPKVNAVEEVIRRTRPPLGHLCFVGVFLLLIALVPASQLYFELREGGPVQLLDVLQAEPTADGLTGFERELEDKSVVARSVRERWQWMGLVALRAGNQKAVIGRDGSIFYRSSLDSATAGCFMRNPTAEGHPVAAIAAFRDSLQQQGVELVLLIAPGKESIYPEWLSRRYQADNGRPENPGMKAFMEEMQRLGIPAVYPVESLWQGRAEAPMYLRQDSHWTPEGMAVAADELVRALPDFGAPEKLLVERPMMISSHGDLYQMLALHPRLPAPLPPETVTIRQVLDAASGQLVESDLASPVVLLGDSFTNIYSVAAMGWGDHAGLGEHLALRLGQPLDVIALNDGGVNTARVNLARRSGALDGKRLVIWQFAMRDLVVSNGEWREIDIAGREDERHETP